MLDEHDQDLEREKRQRDVDLKELQKRLSGCTDKTIKQRLKEWMRDVSGGTENEAQQLLAFFHAWDSAYEPSSRSARSFREDAARCGLSRAVDNHFTALNMKQKVIGTASLDLLRWVIYGHWGRTRQEKQEDDVNNMVRVEAIHQHKTGEKISQAKLARIAGIDRKKVREKQNEDGYDEMVKTVTSVLKKSKL